MSIPSRSSSPTFSKFALSGLLILSIVCWSVSSHAGIFKWKDDQGKVHFTDSLSKIPKKYRKKEKGGFESVKGAPGDSTDPVKFKYFTATPKTVTIPLKPVPGGNYTVEVLLNDTVKVELLVDTGASQVTLAENIAGKLGIRSFDQSAMMRFSTAGGIQKAPLVILDSVKIGDAKATKVEANFNSHMPEAACWG